VHIGRGDADGFALELTAFALSRFEELANFVLVAGIAHAADFELLTVGELKLPAVRTCGGADAASFAKQLRDFSGVLSHIAAADQASQHGDITSIIVSSLYVSRTHRVILFFIGAIGTFEAAKLPHRESIALVHGRLPAPSLAASDAPDRCRGAVTSATG
jgi:hypothetical protein